MINNNFIKTVIIPVFSRKDSIAEAFCIADKKYSYKQFYDIIEQIYSIVVDLPEDNIALYTVDDIRTYASIYALWACGKSYVPLNPKQPRERHLEVVNSINSHYILSADKKYDILSEGINMISTRDILDIDYQRKDNMLIKEVEDSCLAYIIFTSGSTGKPKGVQLTRGNLAAFIDSMNHVEDLSILPEDKCLQPFDFTFDMSVSSYVLPLTKGACVYTIPHKAIKFTYIAGLLEDYHLTVLVMVPSMIRNMLPYMDEVQLDSVRYNILAGEALTGSVLKKWHDGNQNMISYNMYGPTEDTVYCTYYKVDKNNIENPLSSNDIINIGKSFLNNKILLLDENDKIIKNTNEEGELCLCGKQLTPGYWNNEKENQAKFLMINGERYYRTGDLCYYGNNFNLMYVGRKDFQVKINGFRVELGEIENRYSEISGGNFCVVMPYTNEQGNTELAIVIEGDEYDFKAHKTQLANELPAYELPAKWLFIKSIPLNTNGKVDRKAIKKHFEL